MLRASPRRCASVAHGGTPTQPTHNINGTSSSTSVHKSCGVGVCRPLCGVVDLGPFSGTCGPEPPHGVDVRSFPILHAAFSRVLSIFQSHEAEISESCISRAEGLVECLVTRDSLKAPAFCPVHARSALTGEKPCIHSRSTSSTLLSLPEIYVLRTRVS